MSCFISLTAWKNRIHQRGLPNPSNVFGCKFRDPQRDSGLDEKESIWPDHGMADFSDDIGKVLARAKQAAVDYYNLTGKSLGITGEVGEYEASRLLGLTLTDPRTSGYDAIDESGVRYQIKARSLSADARRKSQQLGSIKTNYEWDIVLFVLMDERFQALEIWKAERNAVVKELKKPVSRARNERGALSTSKFRQIGTQIWSA